uniref:Uncharacterized protein n=1 Tax=Dromaius novaehollandiae TaxID=8790 RepID=A0A8C4J9P6_DRONO
MGHTGTKNHQWYKKFMNQCPAGQLTQEFKAILGSHGMNLQAIMYVEKVFHIFDVNKVRLFLDYFLEDFVVVISYKMEVDNQDFFFSMISSSCAALLKFRKLDLLASFQCCLGCLREELFKNLQNKMKLDFLQLGLDKNLKILMFPPFHYSNVM